MHAQPASLKTHRIQVSDMDNVVRGEVRYSPLTSCGISPHLDGRQTIDRLRERHGARAAGTVPYPVYSGTADKGDCSERIASGCCL